MRDRIAEYAVIGGGPAAICAVAKLYGLGIPGNKIIWVDPQFKGGHFGTKLSAGSSVPGNTTVESYQRVNHAIYTMIPACAPTTAEKAKFAITTLPLSATCALKIAAQPLQHITKNLGRLVHTIQGIALAIHETKNGIRLDIQSSDNIIKDVLTKRAILAVGAEPKTIKLPKHITIIDPNIAFIKSELKQYLHTNPSITTVIVIGSSHSAALATMHLLQAGILVKQFMNKEYKFATPVTAPDGTPYMQFDNTGLKGEVAIFTRQLLSDTKTAQGKYAGRWECHSRENIDILLATHLAQCTHAVICVGYAPASSLPINGLPLATFKYDKHSTQIMYADEQPVAGIFGIGVAFPLEVKSISGEIEFAVGVGKFWGSISDRILQEWDRHPATITII